MLVFNEIKRDHKSGYNYFEYECKWYGYDVTIILDDNDVLYHMVNEKDYNEKMNIYDYYISFKLDIERILKLSYKEYVSLINDAMYYNRFTN